MIRSNVTYENILGLRKRCIRCRSRGDLGSCADPFLYNVTQLETEVAVHVEECPSGWCGKIFEGTTGAFRLDGAF